MRKALEAAKASVKLIAPRLGGIRLVMAKKPPSMANWPDRPPPSLMRWLPSSRWSLAKNWPSKPQRRTGFAMRFGRLKAIAACKGTRHP
jgi:hypothetical protein